MIFETFSLYASTTRKVSTDAQKIGHLESQLRGYALASLQRELQWLSDNPKDPANPQTARTPKEIYEHAATSLKSTFGGLRDESYYRDQLQTRIKRSNETFQAYAEDVLQLCRRAGITKHERQIDQLFKGLPMTLAACIRPDEYYKKNVSDFLAAVHRLHSVHQAAVRARALQALESAAGTPDQTQNNALLPSLPTLASSLTMHARPATSPPLPVPKPKPKSDQNAVLDSLVTKLQALVMSAQPATACAGMWDPADIEKMQEEHYFRVPPPSRDSAPRPHNNNNYHNNSNYNTNNRNNGYPRYEGNYRNYRQNNFNQNRNFQRSNSPQRYRDNRDSRSFSPKRRNTQQNPSYRTQGPPSEYSEPKFERRAYDPHTDAPPRCNQCTGRHFDIDCLVNQKKTPRCNHCSKMHMDRDCPFRQEKDTKN